MTQGQTPTRNRAVLDRLFEIMRSGDTGALDEVLHPDFVQEIPQSRERIVGREDFRKIVENYPGGAGGVDSAIDPYVAGDEEHYIVTPTFNVVKVTDSGNELTSYTRATYPDGSQWYVISFSTFKDAKIIKMVDFYAPLFDPPEWRAQWVEKY